MQKRRRAALEAPRRTDARQLPHEQPQIEAADVHEQPFQDVEMPAQATPTSLSTPVNWSLVNSLPWSVLKIRVWP